MTLGYGLLTIGALFIYTAIKNMSIRDIVLDRPGPGQPEDIAPELQAGIGTGAKSNGDGGSSLGRGAPSGVGSYGGKPVAKWIIPILKKAKKAGWDGCLSSGYRSPEYSRSLCMNMCGAPSCSGTCAGTSSNHGGKKFPDGAVDVCNPESFERAMQKLGHPLKNDLPNDRVHYSKTGH